MIYITENDKKTKKIGARVTEEQKKEVLRKAKEAGFINESEYVLYRCLDGAEMISLTSPYQIKRLKDNNSDKIFCRVSAEEKEEIMLRFEASKVHNFSRFVRNCCLGNPIIVITELKEFSKELHKVGNNLNQLTMLCHQGLIDIPDIFETRDCLKKIYKQLSSLSIKNRLGR